MNTWVATWVNTWVANKANMQQWSMQTHIMLPEGIRPDDPDLEWKDPELYEEDE